VEDLHVIVDEDFVVCAECGKKLKKIDGRHTSRSHKITFKEYKEKYPGSPTITRNRLEKEKRDNEKRKNAKKEMNNQLKDIICCNPDCLREGKSFKGNINLPNKYTSCPECKKSGYKNPKQAENYEKLKEGMLRKFGVENASLSKEIVEKRNETVEKHKEENPNYYKEIVETRQQTNEEVYGEDWKSVFHEESKKGMKGKHGHEYALQVSEFKEQFFDTMTKRTGFKSKFHDPDFQKQHVIDINPMDRIEVRQKSSESLIESWKDPEVREKRFKAQQEQFFIRFYKYLEYYELELLEEYQDAHYKHKWRCKKCGNSFYQNWNAIQVGFKCPTCYPRKISRTSKAQIQVENFIKDLGFDTLSGNRFVIKPYELDILIHSEKVAIEYNGLYFHQIEIIEDTRKNLKVSPKKYHHMKWDMCREKGYRLITILEDEWLFKEDIVKARLKNILNKSDSSRIHGRQCIIKEIEPSVKNAFLNDYHLQGRDSSTVKLGAFHNDELVSVMTFSHGSISKGMKNKENKVWELNRFCSNYNYRIPGIASKLLEHFKNNYEWDKIFSYADLRWSNGNLYRKLNFRTDEKARLNYWYIDINKCKRIHRFALRKRPDEPKDISEMVLRTEEGYKVLWDCGHLKFVLNK
jgi:hypothetical protein